MGGQGWPQHPVGDRFVTYRLIPATQESGKLFPCQDGWDPKRAHCDGTEGMTGNGLTSAPCVYVVEAGLCCGRLADRHLADLDETGKISRCEGGQTVSSAGGRTAMKRSTGGSVRSVAPDKSKQ
jgi:hypothetical protein